MYSFIYKDPDGERTVEYHTDTLFWPDVVKHFNYFLAGCGNIPKDNTSEYPFCAPKDDHILIGSYDEC